jgi:hypothetical protein
MAAETHLSLFDRFEAQVGEAFGRIFKPILEPIFAPINELLASFFQPYATICAVGMFIGTMIWVGVFLNKHYVNRGRPYTHWWSDLRLWTVLSMLPHIAVYFYFR